MRRRRLYAGLAAAGVAAGLSLGAADDPQPTRVAKPESLEGEARLEAAVAQKVSAWRARRLGACRSRALAEAETLADSLILDYARAEALQLERPSRPPRPTEPPLLRPSDTLTLAPFLGDTL